MVRNAIYECPNEIQVYSMTCMPSMHGTIWVPGEDKVKKFMSYTTIKFGGIESVHNCIFKTQRIFALG